MAVQKLGKWISAILFLGAVAATFDLVRNFSQHGLVMLCVVVFQLIYSIIFYFSSLKVRSPEYVDRHKLCCWVGVLYAVLLGVLMGIRQYGELGFTVVLPITIAVFIAIFSAPFIWSIKKLNAMRAVDN